jgi:hypothetical protein
VKRAIYSIMEWIGRAKEWELYKFPIPFDERKGSGV